MVSEVLVDHRVGRRAWVPPVHEAGGQNIPPGGGEGEESICGTRWEGLGASCDPEEACTSLVLVSGGVA